MATENNKDAQSASNNPSIEVSYPLLKNDNPNDFNFKRGIRFLFASPLKVIFFLMWLTALVFSQFLTISWETNIWMAYITYGVLTGFSTLILIMLIRRIFSKGEKKIALREKPIFLVGYVILFLVTFMYGSIAITLIVILGVITKFLAIILTYKFAITISQYLFGEKLKIHERVKKPGLVFAGLIFPLGIFVAISLFMEYQFGIADFGENFFNSFIIILVLVLPPAILSYLFLLNKRTPLHHHIKSIYVWLVPTLVITGVFGYLNFDSELKMASWLGLGIFIILALYYLSSTVSEKIEDKGRIDPYYGVLWFYVLTISNEIFIWGENFNEWYYYLAFMGLSFLIYLYLAVKEVAGMYEVKKFNLSTFLQIFFSSKPIEKF